MTGIPDSEIPNLKIGDVFYECEMGLNIEARVTSLPVESDNDGRRHWKWTAVNTQNDEKIDYGLTEGFSHYGPRLYREPQYMTIVNGEVSVEFMGAKS